MARVRVVERMQYLLRSGVAEKRKFVVENISTVKLCFIEHAVNLMHEFMPCERDLLISRSHSMVIFEGLMVSMCDSFRQVFFPPVIRWGLQEDSLTIPCNSRTQSSRERSRGVT